MTSETYYKMIKYDMVKKVSKANYEKSSRKFILDFIDFDEYIAALYDLSKDYCLLNNAPIANNCKKKPFNQNHLDLSYRILAPRVFANQSLKDEEWKAIFLFNHTSLASIAFQNNVEINSNLAFDLSAIALLYQYEELFKLLISNVHSNGEFLNRITTLDLVISVQSTAFLHMIVQWRGINNQFVDLNAWDILFSALATDDYRKIKAFADWRGPNNEFVDFRILENALNRVLGSDIAIINSF
jgi:hypothetical protein